MYPSDYGYATSGGSTKDRATCLNSSLTKWRILGDCRSNDWLHMINLSQWTLNPRGSNVNACLVFDIEADGSVINATTHTDNETKPTAYLKSSVKIVSGTGSSSDPFILEL